MDEDIKFINLEPQWMTAVPLETVLVQMSAHSSSVLLNWGEDDDMWECSLITAGIRITGFHKTPVGAVKECIEKAKQIASAGY